MENKHISSINKITEVNDDFVVLYDKLFEYDTELSIDDLMRHWIWVDEDVYDLLFDEVDSALCHLLTIIETCEAEHPDFGCAAKHIGGIRHMAEQILDEKVELRTQAWSMMQRITNERKWNEHGGKEAYEALVAERIEDMKEEID